MNKSIFLDRDGTIIKDLKYKFKEEKIQLLNGVLEALKIFNRLQYKVIVVTNQSGIGKGLYNTYEAECFNNAINSILSAHSIPALLFYMCPHNLDSNVNNMECNCRKPKPGLLHLASKENNINLSESYMIGDKDSDVQAGIQAGVKGSFKIDSKHNLLFYAKLIEKNDQSKLVSNNKY